MGKKTVVTGEDLAGIWEMYQAGVALSDIRSKYKLSYQRLNGIVGSSAERPFKVPRKDCTYVIKHKPEQVALVTNDEATFTIVRKSGSHNVLIDSDELHKVKGHRILVMPSKGGYLGVRIRVGSSVGGKKAPIYGLARYILGITDPNIQVDHINHITTDNRKQNLRITYQFQNQQNRKGPNAQTTTGVLGVSWDKQRGRFQAQIQHKHVVVYRKFFRSLEEASVAITQARAEFLPFSKEAVNENLLMCG